MTFKKMTFKAWFLTWLIGCGAIFASSLMVTSTAHAEGCEFNSIPSAINFGNIYSGDSSSLSLGLSWWCWRSPGWSTSVSACYTFEPLATDMIGNTRVMRGISGNALGHTVSFTLYDSSNNVLGARLTANFGTQPSINHTVAGVLVPEYTATVRAVIDAGQSVPAGIYQTMVTLYIPYSGAMVGTPDCNNTGYKITSVSIPVTVTVSPKCDVTANDIDFGTVQILSNTLTARGAINLNCTLEQPYSVSLSTNNYDADKRRMVSGTGDYIEYGLYKDSGYAQPWGSLDPLQGTGTGATVAIPVYARVLPQQTPPVGTYIDTVTVTVTY